MLKTDFDIRDCFIGLIHEQRVCTVQRNATAQPYLIEALRE